MPKTLAVKMKFNETELIEFFGVLPVEQDTEEKEFFNSSQFEVVRGNFILRISFSSTHRPKVIIDLLQSDTATSVLHVDIVDAVAIRIENRNRKLVVLTRLDNSQGSDPDLNERVGVFLDPLKVVVSN